MTREKATIIGASLALAAFAVANVPARSVRVLVDPVSGSVRRQEWGLVVRQADSVEQSDLERWIIRYEGSYTRQWKGVYHTGFSITGRVVSRGCSVGSPIYTASLFRKGFERFVHATPDPEIAEFVRIMRTGTWDEQRQAVDLALSRD